MARWFQGTKGVGATVSPRFVLPSVLTSFPPTASSLVKNRLGAGLHIHSLESARQASSSELQSETLQNGLTTPSVLLVLTLWGKEGTWSRATLTILEGAGTLKRRISW